MSVNEGPKTGIGFRIGDFPWEPSEDHAHENDGYAPNIRLSGIIGLAGEDLRGEVGITTDHTAGRRMSFTRVMEYGSGAEINELDDIVWGHYTIV